MTARNKTGIQVSEDLVTMFYEKPVTEWAEVLDTCDIPHDYFITFAALVSTIVSMMLPFFLTNLVISFLSNALIPKEDALFITEHYLPALKEATKDVSLTME